MSIVIAQKERSIDTTTFRLGENTIVFINEAPDSNHYDYDLNNSDSLCLMNSKKTDWPKFIIDIGANGYLDANNDFDLPAKDQLASLNYGRSRSFGLGLQFKGYETESKRFYISPGLGITWNNYHFENNIAIASNEKTSFSLDTLHDNTKHKLRITYLEVPVIVGTKLGKGKNPLTVQLGVIGGLKVGALVKQKYTENGLDHSYKIKDDFNINPFKIDAIARITIGDIGIFARYSFTSLFKENKGPELYPFSAGMTIGNF